MASTSETAVVPKTGVSMWLFNPFHFVAGGMALAVGIVVILIAGLIGFFSNTHFDGVLDFHTGRSAPMWLVLSEGVVDWLTMGILLLVGGLLVSKSRIRPIDVFGTQALARFPTIVTALFTWLPGYQRGTAYLVAKTMGSTPAVEPVPADLAVFALTALMGILMLIWMVWLMYRGFTVACNVSGGKAVAVFIPALILGEVISKLAIFALFAVS